MTKDFRHVGRLPPAPPSPQAARATAGRRLILLLLQANVLAFLAGGAWLLGGGASPFAADIARLLGYFCLATAVVDLVPIIILKRRWRLASAPGP